MTVFNAQTTGDEVVKAFSSVEVLLTDPSASGLGAQTAISLAQSKPAQLLLAGRTLSKIAPVITEIQAISPATKVTFIELDLSSLSSVPQAAKEINITIEKLDILTNNAGIMAVKQYEDSKDGIEMQFAANHIGHFLLTNLIMARIFWLGRGRGRRLLMFEDWNFKDGKQNNPWLAYGQSKTANILFTFVLAENRKGRGVFTFSVGPGLIVDTKLQAQVTQEMFQEEYKSAVDAMKGEPVAPLDPKTLKQGAQTALYAALAPELREHSGAFLQNCADGTATLLSHAKGAEKQEIIWALSEKLVGEKFEYAQRGCYVLTT